MPPMESPGPRDNVSDEVDDARRRRGSPARVDAGRRNRALDTVRFALIAAVMIYHYTVRWRPPHNGHDLYRYASTYSEYWEIGAYGVHLFFMISGFFIAAALAKYADGSVFLYQRLRRIYPAFLVCCTLTFVAVAVMPPDFKVGPLDYVLTLGFVADNVGAHLVDGAYWSLAVEMKFYLFAALLFALMGRRYWLGLTAVGFLGAGVGMFAPKIAKEILLAPYMPMFLAGIGLHFHVTVGRRDVAVALYAACVALLVVHVNAFTLHGAPSRLVALCVVTAMGLIVLLVRSGAEVSFGPTAYLGVVSYEIYLLHQKIGVAIIGAARRDLGLPDVAAMLLAALSVVAVAILVHEVLQKPIRSAMDWAWARGRDRFVPPSNPVAARPVAGTAGPV